MGVTIKHHLKVGRPVLTHGHRSTWCEKARLFALVILFKITLTVHTKMCVYEGVEKTFVRFYDCFILHVQKVFLSVASGKRCAIRGKEAGVHRSHS